MMVDDRTYLTCCLRWATLQILLEIKTASKTSGLIKKEAAFAVLQKAADYNEEMARVTLGKPHFDETSKSKVAASRQLTLVEHASVCRSHSSCTCREDRTYGIPYVAYRTWRSRVRANSGKPDQSASLTRISHKELWLKVGDGVK